MVSALILMFFAVKPAAAQEDTTPKKKLRSGITVADAVGGEGHNGYFIRVRKGQTISVQIARQVPRDGNFNLTVSRSANFFNAREVKFGKETSRQRWLGWKGKVPATGNYYFYLTGFAPADPNVIRYKLSITVN